MWGAQTASTSLREQLTALRNTCKSIEQSKFNAQQSINRLQYERDTWDTNYTNLVEEINNLNALLTQLGTELATLDSSIEDKNEHIKVVKKMDTLIKRDFRGYLLSNIILYINKKAKEYCNIVFGTQDLEVALEGNDLNISYCGKMFDNLSGGEKQRVDLILQFAIRNMLTAYLNFNSNILVLDEITDFLDKKSCAAVLELVTKELNTIESVFIISHHAAELELPIDSELKVVKNEDGISEILAGV
jgi:DNA repair exonuclease SbcCD ATPase subunit